MSKILFGYKCPSCGRGVVKDKIIPGHKTRISGYPYVVKDAVIGVCDNCGEQNFAPEETRRWEEEFFGGLEEKRLFLRPEEIVALREELNLSREQLALLIGCTRQSIHNWESPDRMRPQSRMADLLFKLVENSHRRGHVDVLSFLVEEVQKLGVPMEMGTSPSPRVAIDEPIEQGPQVLFDSQGAGQTWDFSSELTLKFKRAQAIVQKSGTWGIGLH